MPNYNKGEFLEESINSVINQKYKNWNLFVIDNFSNDNSRNVLSNFYKKHPNVNIIYLSKNKGVAFSRNLGIRLSKSKYISFLDSDDYWSLEKLKEQIDLMEQSDITFSYTDYTPFFIRNNKKIYKKSFILPHILTYNKFINDTCIATSSMIIKRSYVGTNKFPKVRLEDYAFKCKILGKGCEATKVENNLTFYRITKNSLSSNKIRNVYWIWHINKVFNKLSFLSCIKSLLLISISSLKRYGFK